MDDPVVMTELDLDTTLRHLIPLDLDDATGAEAKGPRKITGRDWLTLGVLCVNAAEQARASGSHERAKRYAALAAKCDRMAADAES